MRDQHRIESPRDLWRPALTLVDDIKVLQLLAVPLNDGEDVVVQDLQELILVGDAGDPCRRLLVPDKVVTADLGAHLLGLGEHGVGAGKVVHVGLRVNHLPLHDILGRQAVELLLEDVVVLRDRKVGRLDRVAKVTAIVLLGELTKRLALALAIATLVTSDRRGDGERCRKEGGESEFGDHGGRSVGVGWN